MRHGGPIAAAAALLAWAAAAALVPDVPGGFRSWLAGVAPQAWLIESLAVVIAAPIVGVTAPRGYAFSVALFSVVSAVLSVAAGVEGLSILMVHATLGCAALALATFGRWCTAMVRNPLDAAALSVGLSAILGFGVLVGGPAIAALPVSIVNAALVASPLVTTAWAGGIDLFRTDLLYRISPIAHGYYDYPQWHTAVATYGIAGAVFYAARGISAWLPPSGVASNDRVASAFRRKN